MIISASILCDFQTKCKTIRMRKTSFRLSTFQKISKVMKTLCGASFSKSTVSEVCKDLDRAVTEFRTRPLEGEYPFLTVDATYFKVRENSRIVSKAFMIAYGTNGHGHREILGFNVYSNESATTWIDFLIAGEQQQLRAA